VWNAIKETGLEKEKTIAVVGIGGLGLLGIQFAKAMGYRVAAIDKSDLGLKLAAEVPAPLTPDIVVSFSDPEASKKLADFTDGIGLAAAVVCTDDVPASDWTLHRLQPRGTCVVLGLPETGFKFDAFNLVFREIVVKGSLHSGIDEVNKMLEAVAEHNIVSQLALLPLEQGETIPERIAARAFMGKLVVTI
jgi:D-arabinose 1-dehydrogenase-like Zn-dependent alcohol dehydrogenase